MSPTSSPEPWAALSTWRAAQAPHAWSLTLHEPARDAVPAIGACRAGRPIVRILALGAGGHPSPCRRAATGWAAVQQLLPGRAVHGRGGHEPIPFHCAARNMGATVLLRGPARAARARAADSARPTPAPVCARSAGSVAHLARGQEGVGRGRRPRRRVLVGDNAVAPVCLRYGGLLVARIRAGGARLPGPSSSRAAGANAGLCLGGGGLDSGGGDASDCPVSATGGGVGRGAGRERGEISGGGGSLKKKKENG